MAIRIRTAASAIVEICVVSSSQDPEAPRAAVIGDNFHCLFARTASAFYAQEL